MLYKDQGVTMNGKGMRVGILTCLVSVLLVARTAGSDEVLPNGMVLIPGGVFKMGGDAGLMSGGSQSHGTSYPVHEVYVDGFWMDETEVTNQQFADFVQDTGYVTIAERQLSEDYIREMSQLANARISELKTMLKMASFDERGAIASAIKRIEEASNFGGTAGSIVFKQPNGILYSKYDYTQWWSLVPTANWRSPEGGESTWIGRESHPVVNVSYEDAEAYAKWAGKRLPTEAEWERAARGGLNRQRYVWGNNFFPNGTGVWMANIWQGKWPHENTHEDGHIGTSPVKSFPPNAYGLFDMAGNVWELVSDRYYPNTYSMRASSLASNPTGPSKEFLAKVGYGITSYVLRGGSFLCSDEWCRGYQPGSRQLFESDSPSNHGGFRCAKNVKE